MKTIEEKINYYKESLDLFDDGMDKYKFLIDQAKNAKDFPEEFRNDMIKVNLLLKKSKLVICGQSTFAIDSSCTDTPIINISFEGEINVNEKLSVKNRYNVDHYQKLMSLKD